MTYLHIHKRYAEANLSRSQELHAMQEAAPQMIRDLCVGESAPMSLRQLARRLKKSPTYISHVLNGHTSISPAAFLCIALLHEKEGAHQ